MSSQTQLDVVLSLKDQMSGKISGVSNKLAGLGTSLATLGGVAAKGMGLVATGIGLAGGSAIKSAADLETLKVALKTAMGGSESAAGEAYKTIENFATKTPYQMGEVMDSFIKLKNMGLNPGTEALTAYGDTASSMGKSLNQMIEAVADAATGEFERLKEFGIRSSSEGDRVKFTFKGVTTEVGKNSKEIEDYLIKLGQTNFGGGMEEQSKTLMGRFSTLKDTIGLTMASIATDSGLFYAVKDAVLNVTEYLDSHKDQIKQFFTNVSNAILEFGTKAWEYIKPAYDAIANFFSDIENRKAMMVAVLAVLTLAFSAWAVSVILAVGPILLIIATIGTAVFFLSKAWNENWGGIQDKTRLVVTAIMGFYNTYLVPFFTELKKRNDEVVKWWRENWDNVKTVFSGVWQAIVGIFQVVWALLSGAFKIAIDLFTGNWKKAWEDVKTTFENIFKGIYNFGAGIFKSIVGAVAVMVNGVISHLNKLIEKMNKIPGIDIGKLGNIDGSMAMDIPMLSTGTNYVPRDMVAYLHQGEAVVPKKYNTGGNGAGGGITIQITGENHFYNEADEDRLIEKMMMALSRQQEQSNWGIS